MPLSTQQRHALARRGHKLNANYTVAAEPGDAAVAHLRQAFEKHELIKVRIETDDKGEFKSAAAVLAERVPCEVVQLIGRVALLYSKPEESGEDEE